MREELDPTEIKITKIEKYIKMIWGVLVRNWGKLIVLSLLTIIVWFCSLVKKEIENTAFEATKDSIQSYDSASAIYPDSLSYYPAETNPDTTNTYN
jgi:hypothetical protein